MRDERFRALMEFEAARAREFFEKARQALDAHRSSCARRRGNHGRHLRDACSTKCNAIASAFSIDVTSCQGGRSSWLIRAHDLAQPFPLTHPHVARLAKLCISPRTHEQAPFHDLARADRRLVFQRLRNHRPKRSRRRGHGRGDRRIAPRTRRSGARRRGHRRGQRGLDRRTSPRTNASALTRKDITPAPVIASATRWAARPAPPVWCAVRIRRGTSSTLAEFPAARRSWIRLASGFSSIRKRQLSAPPRAAATR